MRLPCLLSLSLLLAPLLAADDVGDEAGDSKTAKTPLVQTADAPVLNSPIVIKSNVVVEPLAKNNFRIGLRPPPSVEIVFVLDTTASMDGLLDSVRRKIWFIINEITSAKPTPELKVGFVLFKDKGDEYETKVFDLESELDYVASSTDSFKAGGGGDVPEHVIKGLDDAVNKIHWGGGDQTYRVIFLAGDAPPHLNYPGECDYRAVCKKAVEQHIIINTIRCDDDPQCERFFRQFATLGEGQFFSISSFDAFQQLRSPVDPELCDLAEQLQATTLAWPDKEELKNRCETLTKKLAIDIRADRACFWAKSAQAFSPWDFTTDVQEGKVKLEELPAERWPGTIRSKTLDERKAWLVDAIAKRVALKEKIIALEAKRKEWLNKEVGKLKLLGNSFDSSVVKTIKLQALKYGLKW